MLKGHVVVDTFTMMLPFKAKKVTSIICWIIGYTPPMAVLTWTMYNLTAQSWRLLEGSGTIWNPPIYPLKTILTAAYANMVIQGFAEMFKEVICLTKGVEDWKKA
jgi:TRAP-type mannitol/chloroaromatic compound transport system permease small subunit